MAGNVKEISVLIVDDSVLVRQAARRLLEAERGMRVIDAAFDPLHAMEIMAREWPDVIVLDIQMPHMDGITFLKKIMAERPTPVVICSTLVGNGAQIGVDALAAGAISLIPKPKLDVSSFFENESDSIVAAVRAAALTNLSRLRQIAGRLVQTTTPVIKAARPAGVSDSRVIALGASTGGTQALETVLGALPGDLPGIVIVQHMPPGFSKKFADRLNKYVQVELRQAENGQRLERGMALLAEAGKQMRLLREGAGYKVEVIDGPVINRHKPSVDCLFGSVARAAGKSAIGVLMTGMGDDGALGMKEMFDAGAMTVAESEETCVVFGMPKMAIQRGGVREVLPLGRIAARLQDWARPG